MRRGIAVASVLTTFSLTLGLWASASLAAKEGGRCHDVGAKFVSNFVSYKCIKVDKRLTWVAEQSKSKTQPKTPVTTLAANPYSTWVADVITIVNQKRAESGLEPLTECSTLDQSAQLHSQDMNARDFFDHTNPDGKSPSDRIRLTGFFGNAKSRWTGENIAAGFNDAASVMAAWMKSPGHRANILNAKFTQLGIGIASTRLDSKYSGYIWTQNFGAGGTC